MAVLKKILFFAPWLCTAILITLLPIHDRVFIKTMILFGLAIAASFQKTLYLESGNLKIRRKLEFAFCGAIALLSLNYISHYFEFWPTIPFFLFLVWAEFSLLQLALLTIGFIGLSNYWFHVHLTLDQYFVLSLTIVFAALFREADRRKKKQLQKKLDAFETFDKKISTGIVDIHDVTKLESRKNSKIGELVQEQDERFEQFVSMVDSLFHPHSVLIYKFDPLSEEFFLQAFTSKSDQVIPASQKLEGLFIAVKSQGAVNFFSKNEINHLPYYRKTPQLVSVAAIPIYHQSLLSGVIVVDDQTRPFSKDDITNLEKISVSISNFLKDSETIYSFFRLKEELASFYAASSALNQAFHLQSVFEIFLKTSHDIVPYDLAFLVMFDSNTQYNRIVAQHGESENWIGETFALSPTKGLVSWVIDNQQPLSYDGYRQRYEHSPVFHKKMKLPNVFQSLCLIPLTSKEETLGAVVFLSQKNGFFSPSSRKILEVLSMQASIAIKNAKMVRDLEQLATTDGLTGLINHRTFQKQLIHELERAKRTSTCLTLMIVDLDHFKRINDNYGHPMGDFVLKEVAHFLNQSVRNVDYVARYGGEEFAIILPDTTSEEAFAMAQRMNERIQKKEMIEQGITLRVTFSIGISTYPIDAMLKEQLIDFADTALYHSKKTGRNRATQFVKSLKMVDFAEKEHKLIERAERILQETQQ